MASRRIDRRPHIIISGGGKAEKFTSPQQGGGKSATIGVDRARHGKALRNELAKIEKELAARRGRTIPAGVEAPRGFYLEFESPPGFDLRLESLEYASAGIELVAARRVGKKTLATVYVPQGNIGYFVKKVEKYLTENVKSGKPKNQALVESIADIRLAVAESFWTDELDALPPRKARAWWEVWLRGEDGDVLPRFRAQAEVMKIEVGEHYLSFPERTVVLARGTLEQFATSLEFLDTLAELRRSGNVGSFFTREPGPEQAAWARELAKRVTAPSNDAVAVCLLDTGVSRGHSLLAPALAAEDMHACKPQWGVADHDGHGTEMAGIAVYGDLRQALTSTGPVELRHRLESVKILPPPPDTNRKDLYGAVTAEGVGYAEIRAPQRQRVIAMAITTTEFRDRGQPTSWSAEIDKLCVGTGDDDRRLFVVSAGNVLENAGLNYRDRNETEGIHDPGQAWNALTVGAFTDRTTIDEPSFRGWTSVAAAGDLSPTSTTSCIWQGQWPIKPDIVMEGGNMALSPNGKEADFPDSLSVLSTHHQPQIRQFCATGDTSAATAAAARLGAIVRAEYPGLWPESVRAVLVDSAEWTPRMRAQLEGATGAEGIEHLVRCFGYGVPNLERALWSAGNALTLIVQDELQPFEQDKSNEMHLHKLPWPRAALESMGATPVELRVTLSYYVEPNPARRGWRKRHRYASHGLRFAMQKPAESVTSFRKRVNGAARAETDVKAATGDADGWLLKSDLRGKGSLHHDRWTGTGADLAAREHLAVYPVIGWWRERLSLERSESPARYSLVVTIRTPSTSVDIYQPVEVQVRPPVRTTIRT